MENQRKPLTATECVVWARELSVREEELQKREQTSQNVAHDLNVLETSISARQRQFDRLRREILHTEKEQRDALRRFETDITKSLDELKYLQSKRETAKAENTGLDRYSEKAQRDIKVIKREISERTAYLREQEEVIARTIEEGNLSFRALQLEISDLENTKAAVIAETRRLNIDKSALLDELSDLHESCNILKGDYDQRSKEIEDELARLQKQTLTAESKLGSVNKSVDAKLSVLHERETSLLVKREALRNERLELDLEKRRWSSTKSLYDVE